MRAAASQRKSRWTMALVVMLAAALGAAVVAFTYHRGLKVTSITEGFLGQDLPAFDGLAELKAAVLRAEAIRYEYYATADRERFLADHAQIRGRIERGLGRLAQAFPGRREVASIRQLDGHIQSLTVELDDTLCCRPIDWDRARAVLAVTRAHAAHINDTLDRLGDSLRVAVYRRAEATEVQVEQIVAMVAAYGSAVFALMLIAAYLLTERRRAERRLAYQAFHDPLTGLPNRYRFEAAVENALRAPPPRRSMALLLITVDRLRLFIDSFGHRMGDEVLGAVAILFREFTATLVAQGQKAELFRMDGAQFALVVDGVSDRTHVQALAEAMHALNNHPLPLDGHEVFVTFSIGTGLAPADGEDALTLVKHADAAMQTVKLAGGNGSRHYTPELDERNREALKLETGLRRAVERGELVLHYQPQVRAATGAVTGFEALVRWRHPVLGMVAPTRFVPLAEDTGLIAPIGEWVLRTACAQARRWHDAGRRGFSIGVNISPRQFVSGTLPQMVRRTLQQSGLPPACLELEITEGAAMHDVARAIDTLGTLRQLGVRLSIDDFGTGYSSLAYLKRFPIDRLKVDQSFVRNMMADPKDVAILSTVIALGRNLRLGVIAEGVETIEQRQWLLRSGCQEIQGFLIHPPVPAEEAERWWDGWAAMHRYGPAVAASPSLH